MRPIKIVTSILAASLLTLPALAAPANPHPPAAEGRAKGEHKKSAAERTKKREARRTAALAKAGVDATRTKQVLAAMQRADAERKPAMESVRTHRQALRQLVESKSTDQAAIKRAIDGMQSGKQKLSQIRDRETGAVAQILKPSEQARFYAALHHGKRDGKGKRGDRKGKES